MAAYFIAQSAASGQQLYKLGFDESVTKWTDPGFSLNPQDLTFFNNAVWFDGATPANGQQLYKLGNDGSVTKWTTIGVTLSRQDLTELSIELWCSGLNSTTDQDQLYKLGFDGSVTKWTANPGSGGGLGPFNLTVFNDALWFDGATPANGAQLYKLGNDGSVTKWTSMGITSTRM